MVKEMTENLQELKAIIRALVIEVGDIKERIEHLENQGLKHNLHKESLVGKPMLIEFENYENIGRIYKEGYHVCNVAFGLTRDGECLFCNALLNKE
ncbi:MAG: initiation control protein YabA [Syntrophomonadaceae bacterium]|jgi:regulator of replication initiation timing|nr:initiation control protein YabA [Syntrophomonadaceae bacterium]